MASLLGTSDWRFLFRQEQGVIDARTWRLGALTLAAPMVAMTLLWFALLPYANKSLDERALLDPLTIIAYAYLMVFATAILLAAVSFYFLSAKRWRGLAKPASFAGLPLVAGLATGGAHWLQPRVSEVMPGAIVTACDVALIALIAWQLYELGFARPPAPGP